MKIIALLGTILLTAAVAGAADPASLKLWVIPELHELNGASPFAAAAATDGFAANRSREELELRSRMWGINLVTTAHTTMQQQREPENGVIINEVYYDVTLAGERFGVGKKIHSWDVGFGFRPLDLIQQENRRTLAATTLEGVPYLAWEKFSGDTAWMLLYVNPGNGTATAARNDESLALKYYLRSGSNDWHAVARWSQRTRAELGAAFATVPLPSTEWHGSLLYQQRLERQYNSLTGAAGVPLSRGNPMVTREEYHGIKALTGITVTGESGFSLLGEAWYDGEAYSAGEWQALTNLTQRQRALSGNGVPPAAIAGAIAYSGSAFDRPNLLRNNLLLRLSHRQEGEPFEPAIDLLCTPDDGGLVATLSLGYTGNQYRIDAGVRQFDGANNSAYRMMPEKRSIYLALQGFW